MIFTKFLFVLTLVHLTFSSTLNVTNELVILFQSQPHIYILGQIDHASSLIPPTIPILLTHSYSSTISNWFAIYPLFASVLHRYPHLQWLFISDVQTRIDLIKLLEFAQKQTQESKFSYVGHGLRDVEPSIIHHYSLDFQFVYPDLSTGVLISRHVLQQFVERLENYRKPIDFIIDVSYEMTKLIDELTYTKLIDRSDLFCYKKEPSCLTWIESNNDYSCPRQSILLTDLYFGIKTFSGFHRTRVPLLKKTWLIDSLSYNLFTNRADDSHERFIESNENTERGHCHKTFFILNYFYEKQNKFNYLIIADDDTLFSVPRLVRLIQCFMLSNDVPTVLGERYGYGEHYDYPTGGSGMIFNRRAVQQILLNCQCPTADTPDDMFLGLCLKRLQIPLIDVPQMHQAQPNTYAQPLLKNENSISFHKFEGINVEQVYRDYLYEQMNINLMRDEF